MKKYLLLLILFVFIGCVSMSYDPVTNPNQRINFEGISFLPPSGENWEMTRQPMELNYYSETRGRHIVKSIGFQKIKAGQNQAPDEVEIWKLNFFKYKFATMNFAHDDDLREFKQEGFKNLSRFGIVLLESNFSLNKFKGMNCVKYKIKAEGGKEISKSETPAIIYYQGYVCVYPRHPNHLVELKARQQVLKGQPPTDIQNEIDHAFNSLEVH